jgi:hypothetical protein
VKAAKRKKLEKAGYKVGSAAELLALSPEEARQVEEIVSRKDGLQIPDGWTMEPLPRQPDYALLQTPPSPQYMATIDFARRGFRSGYSTTGRFVGEDWKKPRKKYTGRGWKQQLVDDAVAHLREVL